VQLPGHEVSLSANGAEREERKRKEEKRKQRAMEEEEGEKKKKKSRKTGEGGKVDQAEKRRPCGLFDRHV
jgi:hypothetical protein